MDAGLLFLNIFIAGLYGATNNQNKLVVFQIIGLCTNVLLNLLLIPKLAHVGASYATVVTESVVFLICTVYAVRRIIRFTEFSFIPRSLVSVAAMVAVLFLLQRTSIFVLIFVGAAVYIGLLFLLGAIKIEEIIDLHLLRAFSRARTDDENGVST